MAHGKNKFRSISNKNGTTKMVAQSGTVLREMLIEATFNQTNF
jgi:NADH:ubiquinone oxidoreductase subunit F (NADH-binding)